MIGGWRICSHMRFLHKECLACTGKRYFASSDLPFGINIPKRIERGPTDILKALSATVGHDPTGFHYKFPDDPYFHPSTNPLRRLLSLTTEGGRRSARYIFEKHPEFFKKKIADPLIESFLPEETFDENSEVSEDTLRGLISKRNVSKAITVYNLLKEKNIDVSNEVEQLLLELTCFYNSKDIPYELKSSELKYWYMNRNEVNEEQWDPNGFAETLFAKMPPNKLTYSAIITGRLRYNSFKSGFKLFNEVKDKYNLSVNVYNEILIVAKDLYQRNEDRTDLLWRILKEMEKKNIQPNIYTLNSVMKNLAFIKSWNSTQGYAENVMESFSKLGVEPSLGSYFYYFAVICDKKRKADSNLHLSISQIKKLCDMKLSIRHPSDFFFFAYAMFLSYNLKSLTMGNLVHNLLMKDDNLKFMATNFEENSYYRCYFLLLLESEQLEEAINLYNSTVPSITTPPFDVYEEFFRTIIRHEELKHLPHFWTEMMNNSFLTYEMIKIIFEIVPKNKDEEDESLSPIFHEAAFRLYFEPHRVEFNAAKYSQPEGKVSKSEKIMSLLPTIFIIFVRNKMLTEVRKVVKKLERNQSISVIPPESIKEFLELCLSEKDLFSAFDCLSYAESMNYPICSEIAEKISLHFSDFSEDDKKWLNEHIDKKVNDSQESEKLESETPKE